jgi:hypothetical protein
VLIPRLDIQKLKFGDKMEENARGWRIYEDFPLSVPERNITTGFQSLEKEH